MSVLVGRPAPDFTAAAVLGSGEIVDSFTLSEAIKGKKAVVFFYPLDFTFVCPSELIAFDHRMEEFKSRGVEDTGSHTITSKLGGRFRDDPATRAEFMSIANR